MLPYIFGSYCEDNLLNTTVQKPGLVVLGKREIKTTMDRWLSTSRSVYFGWGLLDCLLTFGFLLPYSVSAHLLVHSPSPVLVVK